MTMIPHEIGLFLGYPPEDVAAMKIAERFGDDALKRVSCLLPQCALFRL
ncbi:MAG: DUF3793 family protein [Oscillospiraceae bacterium]|nr:DUF3793 family protein [Oscillospiraceae bacterium]